MKENLQFTRKNVMRIIGLLLSLIILALAIIGVKAYKTQEEPIAKVEREEIKAGTPVTTVPSGYTAIRTATDLVAIDNNLSGNYILMADIDLSNGSFNSLAVENDFTGIFDGNYHKIKNLVITSSDTAERIHPYIGLFSSLEGATVKNLEISNITLKDTMSNWHVIGALAGRCRNSNIDGIRITGNSKIEGKSSDYIGGIFGGIYNSTIQNCYSEMDLLNTYEGYLSCAGGIAGEMNQGTVKNCSTLVTLNLPQMDFGHGNGRYSRIC